MKRYGFTPYLLIAGLALLLISGCQKQSKIEEQLQPTSTQAQEQAIIEATACSATSDAQ